MKTTNVKNIELRGSGVCKIKDDILTISGIELDIKDTENTLIIDGNNICVVVGNNNIVTDNNTVIVGMQNCVIDKVINVAQNITIINNGKRIDYHNIESNGLNKETEFSTEQYKLYNKLKELKISGSGSMIVDTDLFDNNEVYIQIKGSGDFEIENIKSKNIYLDLMGSGDVYVKNLVAKNLMVTLKGSGDIKVKYAKADNLEVSLLGSGDINIIGNFKNVNQKLLGTGDLRIKNF